MTTRRWTRRTRWAALIGVVALVATLFVAFEAPVAAQGASECGPNINKIVCENQKTGTPASVWDIDGAGDPSIQGFATDISVNVGQKIDFKIDTDASNYSIDIYRTGWYQGNGARYITSVNPSATLPQNQPECISDIQTELYDCGTWGVSASWNVPSNAVSGVYVALLERADTGGQSHIIFIVREDGNTSDVLFQTSDPTWHAYNTYGGSDFYQGAANGRAYKISYNRPFATRGGVEKRDFYFSSEYATVRFMERNGYDMSYIAGVDTDRRGGELLNHDVFLSVGHDEYWSGAQRKNMETARDAGVNFQFLTGNEGYWRTRYEPSVDGSNTNYRTLVSYKETWGNSTNIGGGKIDNTSPEWTGTWRDPRFATAANGGHSPENALTGTIYMVNHDDLPVTVNSDEGKLRMWRNTGLSSLAAGASAPLAPSTVGYESNEDIDNGFRPAGLIRLSTTVGYTPQYLTDYGNTVVEGTTTHNTTLYKASSDALVFSAGSVQWGWGLDATHDGNGSPADIRMQQAQVNLLADMDAQPGSLMTGLTAATKSSDTTAPTTTITSPTEAATIENGTTVTVTGTASDVGGRVAGVEVSIDGGQRWHPAQGREQWTYTYPQTGNGARTIMARAIDDSANFSTAGVTRNIVVGGSVTAFGSAVPSIASANDPYSAELGLRFGVENDGFVLGVRFYKGAGNTGQHVGSLWSPDGQRMATVTFVGESASGWQSAYFDQPVEVISGQTYTVSYTAPAGGYAIQSWYWPYNDRPTAPILVSDATGAGAAGVFGDAGRFPSQTHKESNYFVDVIFDESDVAPLRVNTTTPSTGAAGVNPAAEVSATFNRPIDAQSLSFEVFNGSTELQGTVSYDATTRRARFAPLAELPTSTHLTVRVSATDAEGAAMTAPYEWSFTTRAYQPPAGVCPCSINLADAVPAIGSADDTENVTVGTRFQVDEAGYITGIRYFRGANNPGPHTGNLWRGNSEKLATVEFSGESATGWQVAQLSTPVRVVPGEDYVVSYVAPEGGYSVTPGRFAASLQNGPLIVAANGGAFTYTGGFPSQSSASDYSVDVVFERTTGAPRLLSSAPAQDATGVARTAPISATFNQLISAATISAKVGGTTIAGSSAIQAGNTVVFTPSAQLPANSKVDVTVTGITSEAGAAGDAVSWSFTTAVDVANGRFSFFGDQAPVGATATTDTDAVILGMDFTTAVAGKVEAIRFYKDAANTGQHVGWLWGAGSTPLAQVTFQGETASGWQRAALSSPVTLEPGVTYTVAYSAPRGGYTFLAEAFNTEQTNGPLTAAATNNGRFTYAASGRPASSWRATNYFVDVEFVTGAESPEATQLSPSENAADVALDANVSSKLTGLGPLATPTMSLSSAGGSVAGDSTFNALTGVLSFDPASDLAYATTYTAKISLSTGTLREWSFSTGEAPVTGRVETLMGETTPTTTAVADGDPVELGTAFSVAEKGWVTAIRFFKGAGNDGAHTGTLWNYAGDQQLATVTFSGETESGWQRAALSTPVELTPGQPYVVSYFAPLGHYSATPEYFLDPVVNGSITGLGQTNGRFNYSATGGFPTGSWRSTAYFVDVEVAFGVDPGGSATPSPTASATATPTPTATPSASPTPTATPSASPTPTATPTATPTPTPVPDPVVSTVTPASAATNVNPAGVVVSATIAHATSAALTMTADGDEVAGASAFDSATGVVTFTPAAALARGKTFTVGVTANGTALPDATWSFTTTPAAAVASTTPTASASNVNPASVVVSARLTNASTASIALSDGASGVAGTSQYSAATGIVTFTPTAALSRGKTYTATLTGDGAPVASGSWSFSTTPPPALTGTTPSASATNVDPASATVTATFSNASAASIALSYNGTAVPGSSSFNASSGVATFTPSAALVRARTYTATVVAEGQAVTGGTWSFTTIPNPAIVTRTPAASATRVVPGTAITASISNAATAAITMTSNGSNVAGTSSFNAANGVVTFTPTASLGWNRSYTVTATANGAALSGGTWTFTTTPQAARTAISPASNATNVNPASITLSATLTNAVTASIAVKQGTTDVAGTSTLNTSTGVVTFVPTAQLDWSKTYTATVTANGAAVTNGSWSFTTMAKQDQVSMFTTGTPANANTNAGSTVQTGTRFRTSVPGVVTTIRYYKGSQNTGTHIGALRTASGTILSQVTFSGESTSGWQTAVLSTPVRLTPGTEYRVTLYSSSGRYSTTQNAFTSPVTYGPLTALGGVSGYGTSNPTGLVASNFWVDVVFDPDN